MKLLKIILLGLILLPLTMATLAHLPSEFMTFRDEGRVLAFLGVGVTVYALIEIFLSRPMRTYVFGHELTHANPSASVIKSAREAIPITSIGMKTRNPHEAAKPRPRATVISASNMGFGSGSRPASRQILHGLRRDVACHPRRCCMLERFQINSGGFLRVYSMKQNSADAPRPYDNCSALSERVFGTGCYCWLVQQ